MSIEDRINKELKKNYPRISRIQELEEMKVEVEENLKKISFYNKVDVAFLSLVLATLIGSFCGTFFF